MGERDALGRLAESPCPRGTRASNVLQTRTPDALRLAAAQRAGCTCFVTNDRDLPEVAGLRVV